MFLSYKAEDRPRVAPLVAALEADGISVWWDAHIGGGDDWRATIQRHLDVARCVIVAWSKGSIGPSGHFVRDEASRAQRRGVYLPIRIDKVDPPLGFGETQALPLNGWKGDRDDPRYRAILAAVSSVIGFELHAGKRSAQGPKVSRRTVVAGSAIAAVSAIGFGGWWWSRPASAASDSIAVLPFANLSGDPAQAYFSDGMAEELRSALSRVASLKVVARTSSEAMRDADAKAAARTLGVASILTGSVRRSPTMIRISAQLIDGRDGLERWSQVYDRPAGDSLQIQTDIADHVARALSIEFAGNKRTIVIEGGTSDPAAQDLLLKAMASFAKDDREQVIRRSIAMIDAAIELDPNYAIAWARRAGFYVYVTFYAHSASETEASFATAESDARRAIQLAPRSRLGYWALGESFQYRLNLRAALEQYQQANSLPGDDAASLQRYAIFLSEIGRPREALPLADKAVLLDPLSSAAYLAKAQVLSNMRRFAEAAQFARRSVEIAPGPQSPHVYYGRYLAVLGDYAGAKVQLSQVPADNIGRLTNEAVIAARTGDRATSDRLFNRLRESKGDAVHFQLAEILAQQNKYDDALDALDKAWDVRDPGLARLLVDPWLDPLRPDPRFKAILKRLDIP